MLLDSNGGAKFELTVDLSIVNFIFFIFFSQEPTGATAPAGPNASLPLIIYGFLLYSAARTSVLLHNPSFE